MTRLSLEQGAREFDYRYVLADVLALVNSGNRSLELTSVDVLGLTSEMSVRTQILEGGNRTFLFRTHCGGFPLPDAKTKAVKGLVISPRQDVWVIFELRSPEERVGGFKRVRVRYDVHGEKHESVFDMELRVGPEPDERGEPVTCYR